MDKHTTGDGIIAALQVLAGLVQLEKSPQQLIDWNDYPQVMINVKLQSKEFDWKSLVAPVIDEVEKLLGSDGRVIVRASGTEPLVRVMVEAKERKLAQKYAEQIANTVR